jgi:hypothetical protein
MKCIAYVRSDRAGNAWEKCKRRAARNSDFCIAHRDATTGAVLGLLVEGFPERAARPVMPPAEPAVKPPFMN